MTARAPYFDTSILVPLYLESPVSPLARRVIADSTDNERIPATLSELTKLEFVSTVAKHVRTRQIDEPAARDILSSFEWHCLHSFAIRAVRSADYEMAQHWIRRLNTSLRTMDALHMAVAVANGRTLVTADRQLADAAKVFGVDHYFVEYA